MTARMTAARLGTVRLGVCLVFLLQGLFVSGRDLGAMPAVLMHPPGVMQFLSWTFYDRLVSPHGMMLFKATMLVALALAAIGYCSRLTVPIAALLELVYQGVIRSFTYVSHPELAGLLILFILACSPAGDGFSFDALARQSDEPRAAGTRYGYPIALMQGLLAWVYFSSGVFKLRESGLAYFGPDQLPVTAIHQALGNLSGHLFQVAFLLPPWRSVLPLALATIVCWELLFPVALVVPGMRRVWLPLGLIFHLTTRILLNVAFWNQMAMYLIFVDWPAVGRGLAARWPRPAERLQHQLRVPESFPMVRADHVLGGGLLLWDGACGFCGSMVQRVQQFVRVPIQALPFQEHASIPLEVQLWTRRQMHWVAPDGSITGGSLALIALLRAGGRPGWAALLESEPVRPFTWLGYRILAANRSRIGSHPTGAYRRMA